MAYLLILVRGLLRTRFLLLVATVGSPLASAQHGATSLEPVEVVRSDMSTCHIFPEYVVLTVIRESGLGEDVTVVRRAYMTSRCAGYSENAVAFVSESDEPNYFFGMWGTYVFIDSGTGPNERGLEIVNVESGRVAFSGYYWSDADITVSKDGLVTLYRPLGERGDRATCPLQASESFGISYHEQVSLNLYTGNLEPTGEITCSYSQ